MPIKFYIGATKATSRTHHHPKPAKEEGQKPARSRQRRKPVMSHTQKDNSWSHVETRQARPDECLVELGQTLSLDTYLGLAESLCSYLFDILYGTIEGKAK